MAELWQILESEEPQLFEHLSGLGVIPSMFATELIMSFMGTTLSINQLATFYDRFFERGWVYFNQLILGMF